MSTAHRIDASHVQLALVARKANPRVRWAVLAEGRWSPQECSTRKFSQAPLLPQHSLLSPMSSGRIARLVERTRLHDGLPAVKRTWGKGYKAMLADTASEVMR